MLLQVHVDGAGARALAAAHAAERAQALGVVGEFVVHALAPALALFVARVVPRGVQGEDAHAATVPGAQAPQPRQRRLCSAHSGLSNLVASFCCRVLASKAGATVAGGIISGLMGGG